MPFHCIRCKKEIDKNFKACPHCGEPVTDFLRRYADEPVDGKYQIVERLGAGGMGEVYKVTHTYLGATRVIKVIRPQISDSKDAHDRFLREARTATRIQHPNVATLHDFSALPDGSHYMVWEYIDGENIAQRLRAKGTMSPRYAVRIIIQALAGLEAIHRAGIVHRDISPENIMITREAGGESVKLIDLGVAKVEDGGDGGTRVGVFVGKLRYASPEHLGFLNEGERIDGRADLFSLAMVLYEMLTGRPPFEATSPHEYVMLHSRETQFKPLDLPENLPGGSDLQAVLKRALDRDRNKRYATAREFAVALEQVEKSLPDPTLEATMVSADVAWRPGTGTQPDTLHRATVKSGVIDAGPTVRTPLPFVPGADANPTVRTPLPGAFPSPPPMSAAPAAPTVIESRARHGSFAAFFVIGLIVLLAAAAIAGVFLWNRRTTTERVATQTAAPPPPRTASRAEANVDVVTTPPLTVSETTATTATIVEPTLATTTTQPLQPPVTATTATTATAAPPPVRRTPVPAPQPVATREPEPRVEPERPTPPPPSNVRLYVDGDSGDADVNEEIIEKVRAQLSGVRTVAVRGSGPMHADLVRRVKDDIGLTVSDSADTVIQFDGSLDALGRGRKRRHAVASIVKNGRVIFRYELPSEEYRVGDTPSEAFARVLSEAFN
jgi:eukaryotic-like serine/threonine-protein kinase